MFRCFFWVPTFVFIQAYVGIPDDDPEYYRKETEGKIFLMLAPKNFSHTYPIKCYELFSSSPTLKRSIKFEHLNIKYMSCQK